MHDNEYTPSPAVSKTRVTFCGFVHNMYITRQFNYLETRQFNYLETRQFNYLAKKKVESAAVLRVITYAICFETPSSHADPAGRELGGALTLFRSAPAVPFTL